jgi:aspartate kinase
MGHTTDELLELAAAVLPARHARELDMLLGAGERISIALLSMAILDLGRHAVSLTGEQAGIVTTRPTGRRGSSTSARRASRRRSQGARSRSSPASRA